MHAQSRIAGRERVYGHTTTAMHVLNNPPGPLLAIIESRPRERSHHAIITHPTTNTHPGTPFRDEAIQREGYTQRKQSLSNYVVQTFPWTLGSAFAIP